MRRHPTRKNNNTCLLITFVDFQLCLTFCCWGGGGESKWKLIYGHFPFRTYTRAPAIAMLHSSWPCNKNSFTGSKWKWKKFFSRLAPQKLLRYSSREAGTWQGKLYPHLMQQIFNGNTSENKRGKASFYVKINSEKENLLTCKSSAEMGEKVYWFSFYCWFAFSLPAKMNDYINHHWFVFDDSISNWMGEISAEAEADHAPLLIVNRFQFSLSFVAGGTWKFGGIFHCLECLEPFTNTATYKFHFLLIGFLKGKMIFLRVLSESGSINPFSQQPAHLAVLGIFLRHQLATCHMNYCLFLVPRLYCV